MIILWKTWYWICDSKSSVKMWIMESCSKRKRIPPSSPKGTKWGHPTPAERSLNDESQKEPTTRENEIRRASFLLSSMSKSNLLQISDIAILRNSKVPCCFLVAEDVSWFSDNPWHSRTWFSLDADVSEMAMRHVGIVKVWNQTRLFLFVYSIHSRFMLFYLENHFFHPRKIAVELLRKPDEIHNSESQCTLHNLLATISQPNWCQDFFVASLHRAKWAPSAPTCWPHSHT
jgi:hypothetical protein